MARQKGGNGEACLAGSARVSRKHARCVGVGGCVSAKAKNGHFELEVLDLRCRSKGIGSCDYDDDAVK